MKARESIWAGLMGAATGVLVTGLLLPFAVGDAASRGADSSALGAATVDAAPIEGESSGVEGADPGVDDPPGAGASEGAVAGGSPGAGGAAAAGTGAAASAPGAAASGSEGQPALRATDRGVTATTVKVGLLVLQVGQVEQIGFAVGASVEEQRAAWKAFVDEVNGRGGILGRRIEPVYAQYDVLDYDSLRAACLALTRDAKVFAVLDGAGTYFGPTQLCVTKEHRTPFLGVGASGIDDEYFAQSDGRLFSLYMRGSRTMRVWASELHRLSLLKGRTLGLIGDERTTSTVDIVVAELERRGHTIAHRTNFSEDTGTAVSQVPVEVQQMRSKGVDAILLAGNVIATTQFVQAADNQGYRPQYFASDWASNSQDAAQQNQPPSFEGALAISVRRSGDHLVGRPEPEVERRCREIYERATGDRLQRGEINTSLYSLMCSTLDIFVAGASGAGADLTRASFGAGMARVGRIAISMMGDGYLTTGKPDAALEIRTNRWAADCSCWKPADAFRDAP